MLDVHLAYNVTYFRQITSIKELNRITNSIIVKLFLFYFMFESWSLFDLNHDFMAHAILRDSVYFGKKKLLYLGPSLN